MTTHARGASASLSRPEYWWYRARSDLLQVVMEEHVGEPARVLDVGSADGPSVRWLRPHGKYTTLDIDPRGLEPGGVCASAMALPFGDRSFDVVAAFDAIEHCSDEHLALSEVARVLVPGGRFLMSVPAYQWAWTAFDEQSGHHRRYTRPRAAAAVEAAGLRVERATYAFTSVFPMFAAERLLRRVRPSTTRRDDPSAEPTLPEVPEPLERLLLGLSAIDARLLRRTDLPFGSSVLVASVKP